MVDIWLSFLEPWNANDRLHNQGIFNEKDTSKNKPKRNTYTDDWKPYVENHYPFYVLLFSQCMKGIKHELDYNRSYEIIDIVIENISLIYTNDLVKVLCDIGNSIKISNYDKEINGIYNVLI